MGPSSKDFYDQNGTHLRIFGQKVTHLGGTSPYALTCVSTPRAEDLPSKLNLSLVKGLPFSLRGGGGGREWPKVL